MHKVLYKICQYLQACHKVTAVWLYNSIDQGTDLVNSTINVAVLFESEVTVEERCNLCRDIGINVEKISGQKVDVTDMETASLFMQWQVRNTGKLVVEKDRKKRVDFDVRSRREYFDFLPVLERYRTAALHKKGVKE
ncbi:hypothetical protein SCACP_10970 [Sporomusa carbonis]|uniref:nucleotidyltransferase domain-containing protein n=1 Tax=Sporomusa carbonis TaxID=3076075 RepID=UPI003A607643